ncbi:MAG: hypothetical protein KGN79_04655 [Acidobacteriota bacterium]|nr:hypothetical protein [Acidobacteriota bacterium]
MKLSGARRYFWLAMGIALVAAHFAWGAPGPWDGPAAKLAEQVAGILGPGQTRLTVENRSTIAVADVAAIRLLFELDLKSHGITISGAESANALRLTLSENARERLWVAEVVQGNQRQVTMVSLPARPAKSVMRAGGVALLSETLLLTDKPVLGMIESGSGLVALEPDQIVYFLRGPNGWTASAHAAIVQHGTMARDPHGALKSVSGGFAAWLPGETCTGQTDSVGGAGTLIAQCNGNDDPWPVAEIGPIATGGAQLKAFYNARRNFFTGVVTPNVGVELPPFYSAALVPRALGGAALLIGGIDGKVQLVENSAPRPVSGTRDWGSDFVSITTGCGLGAQVIASSSGAAATDSLRAYELPAFEAVPASAPLATDGAVTAMWTGSDNKSLYVTVRRSADQYEVNRVTASCN